MTLSTTDTRVTYAGDGTAAPLSVPFPFFDAADLEVIERVIATGAETVKTVGTDYTVAGGAGSTGTVTPAASRATTVQWIIRRNTPATQPTDFVDNDKYPAASVEGALDRGAMRDQEQAEMLSRALQYPKTDPADLSTTIPSSIDRANKYLKFDANGEPAVANDVTVGTLSLPVSIGDGGTGATTAAGARTALGVPGLADANTMTGAQTFQGGATLESADSGAAAGPLLTVDRLSASPAANDLLGGLQLGANNSAAARVAVAEILAELLDPTAGSEDVRLKLRSIVAGALADRAYLGAGLYMVGATGGDPGVGKINCTELQVNGQAVTSGGFSAGDIKMTGYASPDAGWLLCDGSAVSRATYAALFAKIGTSFGAGDGSTTFNLPDARGRMAAGAGTGTAAETIAAAAVNTTADTFTVASNTRKWITGMTVVLTTTGTVPAGLTAGATYYVIRASATTIKLASSLANAVAGTAIDLTSQGSGNHTITMTLEARVLGEIGGETDHGLTTNEMPPHTHSLAGFIKTSGGGFAETGGTNPWGSGGNSGSAGNGAAHNNMPPFFGVYFHIKT